jgi:hyperosmotically inducible periplasmic protein
MQDKRKLTLCGAGMMAVLAAALVGCATSKSSSDERSEGRSIDDKNITSHVKEALKREPVYKFEGVDVQTFAGVVQLSGFVNIPEQKQRAVDIAVRQPGVMQVVNSLALKPVLTPTGQPTQPQIYSQEATQEPKPNSQPK